MTITATLTTYRLGENTLTVADETGILDRLAVHVDPSPFGLSENNPRVAFLLQRYGYVRIGDWRKGVTDFQRVATLEPHPDRCETCTHGCTCEVGNPGCGHAYCWGVVTDDLHNTCPGAALVTGATHPIAA